ncbi:unnamed protein product [Aphanomyces euteiches]
MGASASVGGISKEQCQAICGDLFNEAEWKRQSVDGVIAPAKLNELFSQLTDVFLTHDWGTDASTHKQVSIVNGLLKDKGITTWFDEEKMEGNVKKQMIRGIDNTRAIVVFVTQRYIDKVGGNNAEDNCQLEFNYASRRKTANKMIPVLIDPDPDLKNPSSWTGEVGFVLGGHLYLDMSEAFDDEDLMATRIEELYNKIVSIVGLPLAQRFPGLQEALKEARPSAAALVSKSTDDNENEEGVGEEDEGGGDGEEGGEEDQADEGGDQGDKGEEGGEGDEGGEEDQADEDGDQGDKGDVGGEGDEGGEEDQADEDGDQGDKGDEGGEGGEGGEGDKCEEGDQGQKGEEESGEGDEGEEGATKDGASSVSRRLKTVKDPFARREASYYKKYKAGKVPEIDIYPGEDQFTTPRGPNLVPGLMRGAGHYVNEKHLAHGQ